MTKQLMSPGSGAPSGRGLNWSESFRRLWNRCLKPALPAAAIALASQVETQADILFELKQVGPDVTMKGSGSLNTTTLLANGWVGAGSRNFYYFLARGNYGRANPERPEPFDIPASIQLGSVSTVYNFAGDPNSLLVGPVTPSYDSSSWEFFMGASAPAQGDLAFFGGDPSEYYIHLPVGYVSGTQIPTITVTFPNSQLFDFGTTPGNGVWNLPNGEKITVALLGGGPALNSTVAVNGSQSDATSIDFTATFSTSVTGVDPTDFAVTATDTAAGTVSAVAGSGTTYTVTVTGVSGNGTLRLDLNGSNTGIQDTTSTPAQDISGGFTGGTVFTVDHNPVVAATPTSASIAASAAVLGGNVTSDSNFSITERGVVVAKTSDNANPLINGTGVTKIVGTGTTGVFTVNATGLTPNTGYTFKAYAINAAGTSYIPI